MLLSRPLGLLASAMVCALAAPVAAYCAASAGLETRSDVKGVSLVPLGALPRSPENGSLEDYCSGYRARKLTALGRQVARLGWIVTSEAPLGRYQVVTFASGFTASTSAMCDVRNANIAIFSGARLVALAFTTGTAVWPLGRVEKLESGALLIWTDPPGAPIGELHADSTGLRLTAIAPQRSFCNRRATVPNIYGRRIGAARKILIAHGWRPQRPDERPGELDEAAELARQGVIEAESCSGTGVGYCGFNYRGAAGRLGVTTAGEDMKVVGYGVDCRAH